MMQSHMNPHSERELCAHLGSSCCSQRFVNISGKCRQMSNVSGCPERRRTVSPRGDKGRFTYFAVRQRHLGIQPPTIQS